ncbi:hypothetical protein [Pontibacter anaerobius]|uniref:Uncharacterized protein n=1 Tax=Pontibacter anaerobius TaxID=2993940 RepID=A0ABT3RAF2_9BACT|nr:hypothetical protein [Pontibacter anaerobius]MCX2738836.1 hypothetical protein [Pontibacter anaerobius]
MPECSRGFILLRHIPYLFYTFAAVYFILQMKAMSGDRILEKAGRLYLHWRLRSPEKVQRELRVKYEGRYRNAGLVLLFDLLMALAVIFIVAIAATVLYFVVA